jgi:hypothetical protein
MKQIKAIPSFAFVIVLAVRHLLERFAAGASFDIDCTGFVTLCCLYLDCVFFVDKF